MQKPILLTGAAGALGRVLTAGLAASGYTLRLTDIHAFPDPLPPGATFEAADLNDGVASCGWRRAAAPSCISAA